MKLTKFNDNYFKLVEKLRSIMFIQKNLIKLLLVFVMILGAGCSTNQEVKDVWKGTKNFWYDNVSVPASIDYDDTGDMSDYKWLLAKSMIGMDLQLTNLEKLMNNADKPPTNEWVQDLFARFPWLSGFAGVKADGEIIGQVPGASLKPISFFPLLKEDKKQNLRSLRGDVQDTPMGPEVFLATPLYDGHTFLGVVTVYFDMREVLDFSDGPNELIIVAPQAVLWSGKYNFASTPLAGIEWDKIVLKDSSGTVSNENGKFYWTLRYFGNLPLIFAVAVDGKFEETYNSRTGPINNTGFVVPEPVLDDDAEDVIEESYEEDVAEPSEPVMPSPIYPDAEDDDAQISEDETDDTRESDESDNLDVDTSIDESDSDQDEGYSSPSPFGPQ